MINRVLIRIKVVQLLYSYLLNQSEFKLETAPDDTSKDNRYAYGLYVDLLLLVLELAGYDVHQGRIGNSNPRISANPKLTAGKLVKALLANDQMRGIMIRDNGNVSAFDDLLPSLLSKIENSAIFRSYVKEKQHELRDDAKFWSVVMETVIQRDPAVLEAARKSPEFTNAGFERAFAMAVGSLEGFTENRSLIVESRNALDRSFAKAYELYHRLLWLMVRLTDEQDLRLDNAKHKYVTTAEDLNPDMRMVDNRLVARLRNLESLNKFIEDSASEYTFDDEVMVRKMLDSILESDIYRQYLDAEDSYANDCEFWRRVFKSIILPSDELAESLESKSVYWNDDIDIMGEFVIKTIKRFSSAGVDGVVELMPMFKDEVDRNFGPSLFVDAINNVDEYKAIIQRFTSKTWEMERLAFMDIVILTVAMSELLNFPEIPVAVTVNEYVEIANCYSTAKSGQFVNGMLSAIVKELNEQGRIVKR